MYQFESSGNAQILIRATVPTTLMGISYAANDIVALFDNAYFELSFKNNNKVVTQSPMNILNYNTMTIDRIRIEPKSLSYSHYNFMSTNRIIDETIYVPVSEKLKTDASGIVFFTRIPVNTKPVFIKNTSLVNVTGYTVNYTTGQITGLSALANYTVFYYYQEIGLISYELEKVETPYFKIEITGDNNVNGVSRKIFLEIPTASVSIQPVLSFTQDNIATTNLEFLVIGGKAKVVYY